MPDSEEVEFDGPTAPERPLAAGPNAGDGLDPELEKLYEQAEGMVQVSAAAYRLMSRLAYEWRRDKEAMKVLGLAWGRNAGHMVSAVTRYPDWFYDHDGKPMIDAEPEEILSLWVIATLSRKDGDNLYRKWRDNNWRLWQVKEAIELLKLERAQARGVQLHLRAKHARVQRAMFIGGRNVLEITWIGEPAITPEEWEKVEVTLDVRRNLQGPPAAPVTPVLDTTPVDVPVPTEAELAQA